METTLDRIFLDASVRRLKQSASRIEDCLGRLTDEQIWGRGGSNENSAGNLVLHLCGNLGQWMLSGLGGAPDTRDRDAEFAAQKGPGARELAAKLHAVVEQAAAVIERVPAARLAERLTVQGYTVTVLEAVYHIVEHFGQHTGQIIFMTKAATGEDLGYYGHLRRGAHGATTP